MRMLVCSRGVALSAAAGSEAAIGGLQQSYAIVGMVDIYQFIFDVLLE
jgi:hypothetical protein